MPDNLLPGTCTPRLITVDDSCGCTLTRASWEAMTPSMLVGFGMHEIDAARIIAQEKELRAAGVVQRALKDLLLSRMVGMKSINMGASDRQSIIAPFFMLPQRHNINANYFVVESGTVTPTAGTGTIPASAWDLTVINESSDFASPLVDLQKYFLPGKFIAVVTQDAVTKVGRLLQYKVVASVNADAGGVEKALVTVEPPYSATGWAALSAADKAVYQITNGMVLNLANSVSNYESWCYQYPAENTLKLRDFWKQTLRTTWCYNDEYVKALTSPLGNVYWRKFKSLPLAEQRKRQGYLEERDWFNTIFFGQAVNENQTVETYTSLPQVMDPANPNCLLEYKSNTKGMRTQFTDCSRVLDFQDAPLDVDTLLPLLYNLKRHREIDSGTVEDLDAITDRHTYASLISVLIPWYKNRYGFDVTRFYNPSQQIKFDNMVAWEYATFEFPEDGFRLNVFRDTFFDDRLAATPTSIRSASRGLWLVDWSDIQIGVFETRSVTRRTNEADNLYNCVIQPNINHYQLQSKTFAVVVQDPMRHLLVENFSAHCPTITTAPCTNYS